MELLIVGAGSVGGFLSYNISQFGSFNIIGFLDDDINKLGKTFYGHQVLGTSENIDDFTKDNTQLAVVIGIANPHVKAAIHNRLKKKHVNFPNFIAINSWISEGVKLGEGIIIYPGVSINFETTVQDFVIINMNCAIGHNCVISRYSTLAPSVKLAGFTFVKVSSDLGIGAATIQGVVVGENAVIGGQSMLIYNVPDNAVVVGNPGRVIKYKRQDE